MESKDYWKTFWNQSSLLDKKNIHEQVGRTKKGVAIDDEVWEQTLAYIIQNTNLNKDDDLLDLACGSGAISIAVQNKVKSVTAVDISQKLITGLKIFKSINAIHSDILEVSFKECEFSKVILYFALQHFNENETLKIFERVYKWLKPDGVFFCGDVTDIEKQFDFYDTDERKKAFFESVKENQPIIGTWFNKNFLINLAKYTGFKQAIIIDQPENQFNSHYRFDIKLIK